ncbi:MAG: hypothetical protein IJD06_01975 [Clostridia bacterium]|nr:hypothetical protein [Clostridia bacterium]
MVVDQLNLIKKQTEATLRNKASGSVARLRAETSLVKQASRLTGRMNRELEQSKKIISRSGKARAHRVETDTAAEAPRPVKPASDGYVRRSAVQTIRVPKDYHRQIARRIGKTVLAVICVLAVIWLLLQSKLLTY